MAKRNKLIIVVLLLGIAGVQVRYSNYKYSSNNLARVQYMTPALALVYGRHVAAQVTLLAADLHPEVDGSYNPLLPEV